MPSGSSNSIRSPMDSKKLTSIPCPVSKDQDVRQRLRRCSEATIEAAIEFQSTRNPELVHPIVVGVLARFIEPNLRELLIVPTDDLKIVDDLGVDSLLLVEIVILLEDVLGISIPNEAFRGVHTLSDVRHLCSEENGRFERLPFATGGGESSS